MENPPETEKKVENEKKEENENTESKKQDFEPPEKIIIWVEPKKSEIEYLIIMAKVNGVTVRHYLSDNKVLKEEKVNENTRFVSNMVRKTENNDRDIEAGLKFTKKIREFYPNNEIMIFTGTKYIKENKKKFEGIKNVDVTCIAEDIENFVKF